MRRKFVKRSKISAILSDNVATHWSCRQQVGMHINLLSAGSNYLLPITDVRIPDSSVVRGKKSK